MRRRLTSLHHPTRRRNERGAFAIIFAACAVMLLVLSAFTVDLGQAYVMKRQLQTAADAGALAAAQVYKGQTMTCSELVSNADLRIKAQRAAEDWAKLNRSGVDSGEIGLGCTDDGLTVDFDVSGNTPQVFGQLATGHSTISTSGSAQATIGGGVDVGNLRPWGICSGSVKATGVVTFVPEWDSATSLESSDQLCSSTKPPGNWWVGQCVGQQNGTPGTLAAIRDGCPGTTQYEPVPQQATHNTSSTTLYNWFIQECPTKSSGSYCLTGDNGKNAAKTDSEWQKLVGKYFQMPVLCGPPDCKDLAAAMDKGGNNVAYGIEMIATVQLCGFKLSDVSSGWPSTGLCATSNPHNYQPSSISKGFGLFVVITALSGGPSNVDVNLNAYNATSLTR